MKRSILDSRFGMESAITAIIAGLTQLFAIPQLGFFLSGRTIARTRRAT